jgi:hypothetical protein
MIKLRDGYKIVADDVCYKLVKERTATKKDSGYKYTTEATIGYYGSLNEVLEAFAKTSIREKIKTNDIELKEVVTAINELYEYIQKELHGM